MYGIEDKLLSITISLMILLLAFGVRKVTGTFLVPAGVFAITWFVFTFIPLVVLIDVPINSLSIFYIYSSVFFYSLGTVMFNWRVAFRRNLAKSLSVANFDSYFLLVAIYISAIAAVLLSIITMLNNGFTFAQIVFDPISTSGSYAAIRGTEGLEYGLIGLLSIMFTYLGPVLAGIRIFSPRSKWFFVVSFSPSLLTMVVQSSKLVFLVSLCFYFSGVLVAKIYANKMRLPNYSTLLRIVFGVVILVPIVLVSFVSRLGEFDFNNLSAITEPLIFSISSYTIGQIYAFSDFFSFAIGFPSISTFKDDFYSNGAFTFASLFDMFGIGKEFPAGMYNETGWYESTFETNIFTFFRGLIYDFGVAGSLVFMLIFGIFSHAVMSQILKEERAFFALAVFISIHVFIFMGYLFSVFVARYVFLNAFMIWLLLSINSRLYSNSNTLVRNRKHTDFVGKQPLNCQIL